MELTSLATTDEVTEQERRTTQLCNSPLCDNLSTYMQQEQLPAQEAVPELAGQRCLGPCCCPPAALVGDPWGWPSLQGC